MAPQACPTGHKATWAMSPLFWFPLFLSFLPNYGLDANLGTLDEHLWSEHSWYFYLEQFLWVFDMICAYDGTNETQPPLISLWYSTTTFTKFVDQSFPGLSIDFWLHSFGVFPFASLLFHISLVPLAGQVRSDRVGSVGGQLSFSETRDGDGTMTGYFFSILFLFFFLIYLQDRKVRDSATRYLRIKMEHRRRGE